jgi:hypothetical protein
MLKFISIARTATFMHTTNANVELANVTFRVTSFLMFCLDSLTQVSDSRSKLIVELPPLHDLKDAE